jgi:hypothetical protein
VKLRQLVWSLVFLADRGADERRPFGCLLALAALVAGAWFLLRLAR